MSEAEFAGGHYGRLCRHYEKYYGFYYEPYGKYYGVYYDIYYESYGKYYEGLLRTVRNILRL